MDTQEQHTKHCRVAYLAASARHMHADAIALYVIRMQLGAEWFQVRKDPVLGCLPSSARHVPGSEHVDCLARATKCMPCVMLKDAVSSVRKEICKTSTDAVVLAFRWEVLFVCVRQVDDFACRLWRPIPV